MMFGVLPEDNDAARVGGDCHDEAKTLAYRMTGKNELWRILMGFVTLANTGIVHWWVRQSYKCVMMV